ncbi:MAG: sensor histidine kinase [Lutibacter sp.]
MASYRYTKFIRGIVIGLAFIIVSLILWNTYSFFQKFKRAERAKMEVLALAYKRLSASNLNSDITLEYKIIGSNFNIPMIITTEDGTITEWSNLNKEKVKNKSYLNKQLALMKSQNVPIIVSYNDEQSNEKIRLYIYYRDSDLLTKLKYYPLALLFVLILFTSVIYLFFKSTRIAEQNKLWTGMAKETAHQIGTPLTSLLGWVELLKAENTSPEAIVEIEKDISRLTTITERFSKIGAKPIVVKQNVVHVVEDAFAYLKVRSSKQVKFNFSSTEEHLYSALNVQLFSWVIENIVKNAMDAMQGNGTINISVKELEKYISIEINDNGSGIPKNIQKKIFSPGYSTKKRGWGLGLSLAKRIVESYHKGKLKLMQSELKKGSTFQILLKKIN